MTTRSAHKTLSNPRALLLATLVGFAPNSMAQNIVSISDPMPEKAAISIADKLNRTVTNPKLIKSSTSDEEMILVANMDTIINKLRPSTLNTNQIDLASAPSDQELAIIAENEHIPSEHTNDKDLALQPLVNQHAAKIHKIEHAIKLTPKHKTSSSHPLPNESSILLDGRDTGTIMTIDDLEAEVSGASLASTPKLIEATPNVTSNNVIHASKLQKIAEIKNQTINETKTQIQTSHHIQSTHKAQSKPVKSTPSLAMINAKLKAIHPKGAYNTEEQEIWIVDQPVNSSPLSSLKHFFFGDDSTAEPSMPSGLTGGTELALNEGIGKTHKSSSTLEPTPKPTAPKQDRVINLANKPEPILSVKDKKALLKAQENELVGGTELAIEQGLGVESLPKPFTSDKDLAAEIVDQIKIPKANVITVKPVEAKVTPPTKPINKATSPQVKSLGNTALDKSIPQSKPRPEIAPTPNKSNVIERVKVEKPAKTSIVDETGDYDVDEYLKRLGKRHKTEPTLQVTPPSIDETDKSTLQEITKDKDLAQLLERNRREFAQKVVTHQQGKITPASPAETPEPEKALTRKELDSLLTHAEKSAYYKVDNMLSLQIGWGKAVSKATDNEKIVFLSQTDTLEQNKEKNPPLAILSLMTRLEVDKPSVAEFIDIGIKGIYQKFRFLGDVDEFGNPAFRNFDYIFESDNYAGLFEARIMGFNYFGERVRPFFGAELGINYRQTQYSEKDKPDTLPFARDLNIKKNGRTYFIWGGSIGTMLRLNHRFDVDVHYEHLHRGTQETGKGASLSNFLRGPNARVNANNIMLGLTYHF